MSWHQWIEAQVNRFGVWGTAIGLLWGFMTWAASQIAPLTGYGWGTFIYVGFGAVCLFVLTTSIGLAAWRFFRPLQIQPSTTVAANRGIPDVAADRIQRLQNELNDAKAEQIEVIRQLDGMIGRLDEKVEGLAGAVEAKTITLQKMLSDLKEHTNQQYNLAGQGQFRLRDAILARDAEALIQTQDRVIIELGNRLLAADSTIYRNADSPAKAWLADYEVWERALAEVDRIIGNWQSDFKRYLDLSRRDYEQTPHLPPEPINKDPTIVTPFKTVCIAHERYMQTRTQVANYFSAKIRDSLQ